MAGKDDPGPRERGLYLIAPALTEASAFAPALESALDAADVACVLADVSGLDQAAGKKFAQSLAPIAQSRGAALVLSGDTRLVGRAGADGAHMSGTGDAFLQSVADAAGRRNVIAGPWP